MYCFCSITQTPSFVPFHSHPMHVGSMTTAATSPSSSPSTASSSGCGGGSLNAAAASMLLSPSENVYETAAKLLFMSVRWAKSIPSYNQLSQRDQAALLEDGWCPLFVLSLAQWNVQIDEGEPEPVQNRVHKERDEESAIALLYRDTDSAALNFGSGSRSESPIVGIFWLSNI